MVTLREAKNYLRVDGCEDDKLISDLLMTAKKLCMDVGRMSEESLNVTKIPPEQQCCLLCRTSTKTEIQRIFTS